MTVKNYAPEMIELFRSAATRRVEVKLDTREAAITLRHRLYKLRKSMEKEGHAVLRAANAVIIRRPHLDPQSGKWVLICEPTDVDYLEALRDAGVTIAAPPPPSDGVAPLVSSTEDVLAEFMQHSHHRPGVGK